MKRLHIRIKKNLLLIEEDQELFFIGSYGKGIIIHKSDITNHLLKHLAEQPLQKVLLQKVAKDFSIPISLAQKLITRLSRAGVLETYTPNMLLTPTYKRYETQLSFFDLLQPVKTISKKLNWQKRLEQLHIVIIGIGGIGNFAALSFATMGIGELTLIDNDKVDNSNLNRQILFAEKDIGRKKTEAAAETLRRLNSRCQLNSVSQQIRSFNSLEKLFQNLKKPDLVFISADAPLLPVWVNALTKELACPFIKASYQGSTGFIGPLIEPGGELFETLIPVEKNKNSKAVHKINLLHKHASFIPVNATIANIAVLESVKYLLGMPGLQVKEKRLFFDFSTICIYEE